MSDRPEIEPIEQKVYEASTAYAILHPDDPSADTDLPPDSAASLTEQIEEDEQASIDQGEQKDRFEIE